jgi:hypothetical protein
VTFPNDHRGLVIAKIDKDGDVSAEVRGITYGGKVKGEIKKSGEAALVPGRTGGPDLLSNDIHHKSVVGRIAFTVDTNDANKLTGTVTNNNQTLATFTAYQNVFTSKADPVAPFRPVPLEVYNPNNEKGNYTIVLPAVTAPNNGFQANAYPQGDGWATASITPSGSVKIVGSLADGTKFNVATIISKDKVIPLYVPLYGRKGCLTGEVTLANHPGSDGE